MQFDPALPIWTQLLEEFTRRLVTGEWKPGQKIPGVRDLAADLGVNPNTVQRSLAELERQGLCRAERTAGRFVTDDLAKISQLKTQQAAQLADGFIDSCTGLGIAREQALELIERRWPKKG